jgi:ketosteroid isomerase-like protein
VTEHPHEEVFMRTYEAFTAGDLEALAELFADDVWHTPGRNPLSGDYQGRDATLPPSLESSSCRAAPMVSSSTTSWRTTTTRLRCFAALQSTTARPST